MRDKQTAGLGSDGPAHPGGTTMSRRMALKRMGTAGIAAASTLAALDTLAWAPVRVAHAAPATLPDIQFDIASYVNKAITKNGIVFSMPPVYTLFVTAQLTRTPTLADQRKLASALDAIEEVYPFTPSGIFAVVSYGIPYFNRLPGGMTGALVSGTLPRLLLDPTHSRYALEEAVPGPTDVSPLNPGISKETFNVPVRIEANDLLVTLRSDSRENLAEVLAWLFLDGNQLGKRRAPSPGFDGLFSVTSTRLMFVQQGLPRNIADYFGLPYARRINRDSPMWMGFSSQQSGTSGPATIVTFQGNSSAVFTTDQNGDPLTSSAYFWNGAIQHLGHDILDLAQWYAYDTYGGGNPHLSDNPDQTYANRAQYMFRSDPQSDATLFQGNANQFADGGGTPWLPNEFLGTSDAVANAQMGRMGHVPALQRGSRAADGTPIHIRVDGPGFSSMDVPDGSTQPALEFSVFVPSAAKFAAARVATASLDLVQQYNVPSKYDGIERFLTATRRQNFLAPSRTHRAFPLLELA